MKNKKIYVVACVHGNEIFGLKVLEHLKTLQNPNIITQVANPEAITKKKRFIETDLNRSFAMDSLKSLEAKLAQQIKDEVERVEPDLIIDLHTSVVKVNKVAILAQKNTDVINAAKHLGMKYLAVMPEHIASQSLIGVQPERSICVELGRGLRSNTLALDLAEKINTLTMPDLQKHKSILPLLVVERLIEKAEAMGLALENYVFSEQLKGYPFLTGESNYAEHRGFLATSQIEV